MVFEIKLREVCSWCFKPCFIGHSCMNSMKQKRLCRFLHHCWYKKIIYKYWNCKLNFQWLSLFLLRPNIIVPCQKKAPRYMGWSAPYIWCHQTDHIHGEMQILVVPRTWHPRVEDCVMNTAWCQLPHFYFVSKAGRTADLLGCFDSPVLKK